jgi:glycosyltransferase involved in cell wall biosynthesis
MDVHKDMIISLCVTCHNRTYDLKKVLPSWIKAANISPPVEILILNYNSPDDLEEYMEEMKSEYLVEGNSLVHLKYTGRDYFHMAHARNLTVLSTKGEYIVMMCADCPMSESFIVEMRKIVSESKNFWITIRKNEGVIALSKQEFIDAGGYDERFEFYGPEDKDINYRLRLRGLRPVILSIDYIGIILTPNEEKEKNYRLKLSKREMGKLMSPIYFENREKGILVANEGKEWGKW